LGSGVNILINLFLQVHCVSNLILFPLFATGVRRQICPGVVDTGGKFAAGVVDTGDELDLRIPLQIFEKNRNDPTMGFAEDDS
jgi:hypothetical protein